MHRDCQEGQVRYLGISWKLGGYHTAVLFEAPDEDVAMTMALKWLDRMELETLVTVPAGEGSPASCNSAPGKRDRGSPGSMSDMSGI